MKPNQSLAQLADTSTASTLAVAQGYEQGGFVEEPDTPDEGEAGPSEAGPSEQEHGPWEDYQQAAPTEQEHGPWEDYQRPAPKESSALGTFAREAVRSALPTAAGVAGYGAGEPLGAVGGAELGARLGVKGGLPGLIGGAAVGLGVGALASSKVSDIQDWIAKQFGLDDEEQRQADEEQHPYARMAGTLAPSLAAFNIGNLAKGIATRIAPAGLMGVQEAAGEKISGQDLDPSKIAMATAAGALLNKTTKTGEALMGAGRRLTNPGALDNIRPGRPDMRAAEPAEQVTQDNGPGSTQPQQGAPAQSQGVNMGRTRNPGFSANDNTPNRGVRPTDNTAPPADATDEKVGPEGKAAATPAHGSPGVSSTLGTAHEVPPPSKNDPTIGNPKSAPVSDREAGAADANQYKKTPGSNVNPSHGAPAGAEELDPARNNITQSEELALTGKKPTATNAENTAPTSAKPAEETPVTSKVTKADGTPTKSAAPDVEPIRQQLIERAKVIGDNDLVDQLKNVPAKALEKYVGRVLPDLTQEAQPTTASEISGREHIRQMGSAPLADKSDYAPVTKTGAKANQPAVARARSNDETVAREAMNKYPDPNTQVATSIDDKKATVERAKQIVAHYDENVAHPDMDAARKEIEANVKPELDEKAKAKWIANKLKALGAKSGPSPAKDFVAAARKLTEAKRPNQKAFDAFFTSEKLLRDTEGAGLERETNRIEGETAMNRNAGDERVTAGENESASRGGGRNEVEDEAIERLDRERTSEDEPIQEWESSPEEVAAAGHTEEQTRAWKDLTEKEANERAEKTARLRAARLKSGEKVEGEPPTASMLKFIKDEKGSGLTIPKLLARITSMGGAYPAKPPAYKSYRAKTPKTEQHDLGNQLSDRFQQLQGETVADELSMQKLQKAMPERFMNDATMEQIYHAVDENNIASLPQDLQNFYAGHLKPLFDEANQIFRAIKKFAPSLTGTRPFIHRLAVGRQFWEPEGANASSDPIIGSKSLKTNAAALKQRNYYVAEGPAGNREVISKADGGYTLWKNHQGQFVAEPDIPIKPKETLSIGGQDHTIKEATTREIEAHANFSTGEAAKYYHNPVLSAMDELLSLREMQRHLQFMDSLKTNGKFLRYATTNRQFAELNGWKKTTLPGFDTFYMDDPLRRVFNDYHHTGFGDNEALAHLRNFSQQVTKTMFWNPIPHAANVFWHWWVGRGWDWMPGTGGYRSLLKHTTESMKSVMSQDDFAKQLNKSGAAMMYSRLLTRDFMPNMAKALGMDIKQNPSRWDPITKALGVNIPQLTETIYRGSSHAMWSFSDILLQTQVRRNMELGMDTEEAISHAERHIPNYRIAPELIGSGPVSRILSKVMQDSAVSAFGRYHVGVFNSMAHIVKGLATGTPAERTEAMGNVFALGLFAFVAKPILDAVVQYVSGNKNAETIPRGPLAPLENARDVLRGRKDLGQAINSSATVAPYLNAILETYHNKDWAGRAITEPGDWQKIIPKKAANVGKSLGAVGRIGVQEGEHALRSMVSPYNTIATGLTHDRNNPAGGLAASVAANVADVRLPTKATSKFYQTAAQKNEVAARIRAKKPRGPAEAVYDKFIPR